MFVSRRRRSSDRWLGWKMGLFVVGAVLALIGMRLEDGWLLIAATALLVAAFGLRYLDARDEHDERASTD